MATDNSNIYIYGKNPISETLKTEPERIDKIYVRDSMRDSSVPEIFTLASNNRIPINHVPGKKLYELVGKVNDQGVVAQMSSVPYQSFGEWISGIELSKYPAILLLDEIEDPHNLGAILRSAAAAGIEAVLVPKHRQAPVSPAVFKASSGTAGKIPIVRVGNLNQTIMELKAKGFWIAGLDGSGDKELWDMEVDRPLAFVIGNEGSGIRKKTLEHCDYRIRIPMHNAVESLNASVSAALIAYEWRRKKDQ